MDASGEIDPPGALAQWRANGYLLIRQGISADLCEAFGRRISAEFDRRDAQGRSFRGGGARSGHLNCFPGAQSEAIILAMNAAKLTDLIAEVVGGPVELSSVGCNCNLPGSHYQNFHVDTDWTEEAMVVNIALVDTDRSNGATELVPGTNRAPMPYWRFLLRGLWRRGVRHALKPGDVVIRPTTLWHRGTPNLSGRMRPMIALLYLPANKVEAAFDYQQYGGRIEFMANRFGSDRIGRAVEWICVNLPRLHAMIRICKSLVAPVGRST